MEKTTETSAHQKKDNRKHVGATLEGPRRAYNLLACLLACSLAREDLNVVCIGTRCVGLPTF